MVNKDIIRSNGGYFVLPSTCPPPDRPLPSRPPRFARQERDRVSVSTCSSSSTYMPPPSTRSSRSMRESTTIEPLLLPSKTCQGPEAPNWPLVQSPSTRPLAHTRAGPSLSPRPDSTILPLPTPLQRPTQLERQNFHALVRSGDKVQYWIAVATVLAGFPGRDRVPKGHWEWLTRLAEEVWVDGDGRVGQEQFVTGWCFVDEPLGGEGERDE